MPTTTGVATTFIDFTRASNATVTDSDGKVKWAPHNLLLNSESFAANPWAPVTGASISSNVSAAPNGTNTADAIVATGAGSFHYVQVVASTTYVNASYTLAAFMKKDTNRYGYISPFDGTNTFGGVFDLQNGVYVGNRTGSSASTPTITPFPNGWYLCTVTFTPAAATTSYPFAFGTNNDGSLGLSDFSTGQIFIWGASLYRSDLAMQPNTSAYPMYNPTTPKNLLGYTEAFESWALDRLSVLSNIIIGPFNGLQTADKIYPTSSTGRLYQGAGTIPVKVISVYAKAAEMTVMNIRVPDNAGQAMVYANLLTGVTTIGGAGYVPWCTHGAVDMGNGWWRVWLAINADGPSASTVSFAPCDAVGSTASTPSGTNGIYLWGAQVSDSASLDSYGPVYGAAVTSAAYYGPRRDFDPVTLACKGLLVEEQRVNLWTNSNDFSAGSWVTSSATPTLNNAISPDGTMNAALITLSGAGGDQYIGGYATLTGTYTSSFWIKASDAGQVGKTLRFDTTGAGTANSTITLTASWQRITLTNAPAGYFQVRLISASGFTASAFHLYGGQLEAGSFATSYIPVGATSAGATRLADVASVNLGAIPYGPEATVVVKAVTSVAQAVNKKQLWMGDSIVSIAMDTTAVEGSVPNIATIAGVAATYTPGTPFKAAFAFADGNSVAAFNGTVGTVGTGSPAELQTGKAQIGSNYVSGTQTLNGHIQQITVLPRRLTSTELAARTT